MTTTAQNNLLTQMQWRYATKKFDSTKKIAPDTWSTIENSLIMSASSYGTQPWQFLVVQSPKLRSELRPVSWNQSQVEDCSHFVVFTALKTVDEAYVDKYVSRIASVRGSSLESLASFRKMLINDLVSGNRSTVIAEWSARQCYIALGNLLTTAAVLHVDACPMEGLEPTKYDKILQLESTQYKTIMACALGYRHPEDKYSSTKKVRFEAKDVVKFL